MNDQPDGPIQKAHLLEAAAKELLAVFMSDPELSRRHSTFRVRRAAFAAFEAGRAHPKESTALRDRYFYRAFLIVTILSPVIVVWGFADSDRSIAWDTFGVVSTMILLTWTFGLYSLKMSGRIFEGIYEALKGLAFSGPEDTAPPPPKTGTAVERGRDDVAFANLLFFILGLVAAGLAIYQLWHLFGHPMTTTSDIIDFNRNYAWFFLWIVILSMLFIAMDLHVAWTEKSHTDSFVAASSAVHSTIPMCIGVLMMGGFLIVEYLHMWWWHGYSYERAMSELSVEFVSGALSFQMIMSNVLFIFVKENRVLAVVYKTVFSSERF